MGLSLMRMMLCGGSDSDPKGGTLDPTYIDI